MKQHNTALKSSCFAGKEKIEPTSLIFFDTGLKLQNQTLKIESHSWNKILRLPQLGCNSSYALKGSEQSMEIYV